MARGFLAFLLFFSCTTAPMSIVRYHGICKEKTAWCREIVEILYRFDKQKIAVEMEYSCEMSRNHCSQIDESTSIGKQDFGSWQYVNDICKVSPMLLMDIFSPQE